VAPIATSIAPAIPVHTTRFWTPYLQVEKRWMQVKQEQRCTRYFEYMQAGTCKQVQAAHSVLLHTMLKHRWITRSPQMSGSRLLFRQGQGAPSFTQLHAWTQPNLCLVCQMCEDQHGCHHEHSLMCHTNDDGDERSSRTSDAHLHTAAGHALTSVPLNTMVCNDGHAE
jgi:hypothetical protein